ncbi:MAG TPA: NAD(P)-dependent oxidoreductase [Saprospiraceae bacterium]|nr:NAD(P)-dependent oxidoreductase [Saprospiraceae bacterium]
MGRVLITDDCHHLLMEGLEQLGWQCDFEPNISPVETKDRIAGYEGLVINSKILVDRDFLDKAVKLRFVARLGSGMEIVDRVYAAEKGVKVWSSPEGNRNAVAEQALGMLLGLANNLPRADREVRQNIWRREANRGWEVQGKTLGIIGFGHTGSQFARKLAGMEMRVLACDKYKPEGFAAEMSWVSESNLTQIQAEADIISLHLPLTSETLHFVDANFIQKCKPGFILINTARGKNVKTEDLVLGLESGQIGGACLDVFENEKPETYTEKEREWFQRLHQMENVVLSPHVAGWTHESKKLLAEILLQKIKTG